MDTQANRTDSESGRLVTGRLIQCLKAISDHMATDGRGSSDTDKDTLVLAAACIGLAAFQKSGRLELLGYSPDDLVAHLLANLMD